MSTGSADVIIIGAGIVGAACALALANERLKVRVLESGTVAGGATAAGMGHLVVMDDSEAEFALTAYSRRLWSELAPEIPPAGEFRPCGTIWVASDAEEFDAVLRKRDWYTERGVRAEVLDSKALAEAEPNLRRELAGALLVPDDAVIYAPWVAEWLLARAVEHGAVLETQSTVAEVLGGGVRLTSGAVVTAGVIVCAAGCAAAKLLPGVEVRPRKGHLAITDRYPDFVRHQVVELGYLKSAHGAGTESVAFNVQPRATGQVLLGSSRQFGNETNEIDWPVLARMIRRAVEFMPALGGLSVIRTWTGFRAATPDKLPLIGPDPGIPKLMLATGHEGLGITTAPATAELIVAHVLGREPEIPAAPYLPSRYTSESAHA